MDRTQEKEINELRGRIRELSQDEVTKTEAADKVAAEFREKGVNPLVDKDAFEAIDAAYRDRDGVRDEVSELSTRLTRALEIAGATPSREVRADEEAREERASRQGLAKRFLDSDEYKELKRSRSLEMASARVNTAPVEVLSRDEAHNMLRQRATVDSTTGSGGGLIWSDRREDMIVQTPVRRIRVLDLITISDTDTDTIEWVEETTMTDAAAETPYGTAAPEAAYGYTKRSAGVERITHHVPALKGTLADGGQLSSLLENRLVRGVRLRLESQAISGDGVGDNLTGVYNTTGIGSIALGADTRWDAVHKAITNIRVNLEEDEANAVGIHPNDYEQIVLEKDGNGNYVHGRPAADVATIWGLTPVVSTVFTEGQPLVGNFAELYLFLREGVSVAASDSHSDFFLKGMVAMLAEARAGVAVPQPKAFCEVTGF